MADEVEEESPIKRSRLDAGADANSEQDSGDSDSDNDPVDGTNQVQQEQELNPDGSAKLSKKQLRRLRKKELFALAKKQKKLKKKEAKQALREQLGLPPPNSQPVADTEEAIQARAERKKAREEAYVNSCLENFHVIIDCDWESEHTDSVLSSLTQQIMFCYGLNKRTTKPCLMHISNLGERTKANLEKVIFKNWIGVSHSAEDYLTDDRFSIAPEEGKKQLIYLTSDAEETLETLDAGHAYIIGGIVDRNRLKGATYNKAIAQGIRTAKLPIKENVSITATPVLTVNHVYEILLKFNELKNWAQAIEVVLPRRKEAVVKKDASEAVTDDSTLPITIEETSNEVN